MGSAVVATSWAERLRAAGLRVTQPRLAVLHVVHADPHIAADQVAERVRADSARSPLRPSTTPSTR